MIKAIGNEIFIKALKDVGFDLDDIFEFMDWQGKIAVELYKKGVEYKALVNTPERARTGLEKARLKEVCREIRELQKHEIPKEPPSPSIMAFDEEVKKIFKKHGLDYKTFKVS